MGEPRESLVVPVDGGGETRQTRYFRQGLSQGPPEGAQPRINVAGTSGKPRRVRPPGACVLGPQVASLSPTCHDLLLGENPAMRIERRNPKANDEIISLVAQLLECVCSAFPEGTELDLDALAFYAAISFSVRGTRYIEPFRGKSTSHRVFADRASLTRGPAPYPCERGVGPRMIRSSVVGFQLH